MERDDSVSSESVLKALRICIQNNIFQFNEEIYHQKEGVGTGMKLAPPFACLGVRELEKQFFNSDHDLVEIISMWKRFIDDIFTLIKGPEESCKELVNHLNTLMPGVVTFTYSYSSEKVVFLDLEISLVVGKQETNPRFILTTIQTTQSTQSPQSHTAKLSGSLRDVQDRKKLIFILKT